MAGRRVSRSSKVRSSPYTGRQRPPGALRRFYDERLDSSRRRDTMLGQPAFYKAEGAAEGQGARTALMSKPGTRPGIVFAPADGCDQELLDGAQTMIEIV